MRNTHRKKIGVIMPAIVETLDPLYLEGIYRQVSVFGYDVIVFTCSSNMQKVDMPTDYILAEEQIYRLAAQTDLAGLIFAAGKFHDEHIVERILDGLHTLDFPCVTTCYDRSPFLNVTVPQCDCIREITEHLIEVHGFRNILCLTGPQGNLEAEDRLTGWRVAMERAGLPTDNYRYGDFWVNSPVVLADDIAAGRIEMPEAIVCTSDFMATALCKQLAGHGIRVPEDIAVTGYDGGPNATLTEPSLTTVDGKEFELGSCAAITLLNRIDGKNRPLVRAQRVSYGRSCGCCDRSTKEYFEKIREKYIVASEYRDVRAISDYINRMASAESLTQLSERINELASLVPYWNDLYVCVRQDLSDMREPKEYPEQMRLFVSRHRDRTSDGQMPFRTEEFLPSTVCSDGPQLMIATPLHISSMLFGYIVTTYSDPRQYAFDDLYVSWRDSISNAISVQYIKAQNRQLNQRLEQLSHRDRMTGMLNLKGLSGKLIPMRKYACILLEIQWVQTPTNCMSLTPELFVANALQMNCSESELCFRYNQNVFGVMLPLPARLDLERCCEEWVLRFDAFIDLVRQRDRHLEKPVIRMYYDLFRPEEGVIHESLERLIESHLHHSLIPPTVKGGFAQQLEETRRQIIRLPSGEWSQEHIARAMQISVSYFRRIYKQHFGVPFHSDLIHLRMSHAMKLLRQTDMNVKVIAEQCGYPNMYHFMTAFKKETGLTTTEFRTNAH
ncbi:MAG: substrate-binding domain-containing protein [Oscillospiraceae bacterium]|nr:substrate-binding domain-containing protein [Oscillospiraceae bacterium]